MCLLNISDDFTRNKTNPKEKNNINDFSNKYHFLLTGGFDIKENKPKVKLYQILTDESNYKGKDQMKDEDIKGIRLSELQNDELSQLKFEGNIISINQIENEISILTKENTYDLSFDIY